MASKGKGKAPAEPTPAPAPAAASPTPAAPPAAASTSGNGAPELDPSDVNTLASLVGQEKIKMLMKSDPKFIGRLIGQLDSQMGNMMRQKQRRIEQMAADQAEIDGINNTIKNHVQPSLDRLNAGLRDKQAKRDHLLKQMEEQTNALKHMQRDAAALISSVRGINGRLQRKTASQKLEETRGFSAVIPTTTLIRGGGTSTLPTTLRSSSSMPGSATGAAAQGTTLPSDPKLLSSAPPAATAGGKGTK